MLKKTELNYQDQTFSCELTPVSNDLIICKIYKEDFLNFQGKLSLKEVYSQIPALDEYSMEELFKVLNALEKDKFEIINSSNVIKLKIMIQILKKMKELYITLEPKSHSNEEIIQYLLTTVRNNEKEILEL